MAKEPGQVVFLAMRAAMQKHFPDDPVPLNDWETGRPGAKQVLADVEAAIRASALEDAAKCCEDMQIAFHPTQVITDRCAAAIRSLIPTRPALSTEASAEK